MKNRTEDQVKIYQVLSDLGMKIIFGFVALVFFVWIVIDLLLSECSLIDNLPRAGLGIVLTVAVSPIYRHFFPSIK